MSRGNQRDVDRARAQKRAEKAGGKKGKKTGDKNASQALTNKKESYVVNLSAASVTSTFFFIQSICPPPCVTVRSSDSLFMFADFLRGCLVKLSRLLGLWPFPGAIVFERAGTPK